MKIQQYAVKWLRTPKRKQAEIAFVLSTDALLSSQVWISYGWASGMLCRVSVCLENRWHMWIPTLSLVITWWLLKVAGGAGIYTTEFGQLCEAGVFLGNWGNWNTSRICMKIAMLQDSCLWQNFKMCSIPESKGWDTWVCAFFERSLGNKNNISRIK